MKATTLFTALMLTLSPVAAMAYSESEETRYQHKWLERERTRTEGNTDPQAMNGDRATQSSCPMPRARKQFVHFLAQLQLTEGVALPDSSVVDERYAGRPEDGELRAMTC